MPLAFGKPLQKVTIAAIDQLHAVAHESEGRVAQCRTLPGIAGDPSLAKNAFSNLTVTRTRLPGINGLQHVPVTTALLPRWLTHNRAAAVEGRFEKVSGCTQTLDSMSCIGRHYDQRLVRRCPLKHESVDPCATPFDDHMPAVLPCPPTSAGSGRPEPT